MEPEAWFAVIAAIVGSPVLLALLTAWQRRAEKKQEWELRRAEKLEDWARQDVVAAQAAASTSLATTAAKGAADAARLASNQASEAARVLKSENSRTAKAAQVVVEKLDVIKSLVDGNVTALMRAELAGLVRELVMMRELFRRDAAEGLHQTPDAQAAIDAMISKIAELSTKLAEREATEAQIRQDAADRATE